MKKLSWQSTKGQEIALEAIYTEEVRNVEINLDGDIIKTDKKEIVVNAKLICTVDGKVIDTCTDVSFWEIIDLKLPREATSNGLKRIWGIDKVALTPNKAKEVEAFLAEVIADGKTPEAIEIEAQDRAQEEALVLAEAREIIEKAKTTHKNKDGFLMTEGQAKAWRRNYNIVNNEGGEGFVPEIISQEAYDRALKVINKR